MRKIHRWLGAVSGFFMIMIAVTGVALQFEMTLSNHPASTFSSSPPPKTLLPPIDTDEAAQILADLDQAIQLVRRDHSDLSVEAIDVARDGNGFKIFIGEAGRAGQKVAFNPGNQTLVLLPKDEPGGLHKLLIDLHGGFFFGPLGQIISILMGVALLVFAVTGLSIYFKMFSRRRKIGKGDWFW